METTDTTASPQISTYQVATTLDNLKKGIFAATGPGAKTGSESKENFVITLTPIPLGTLANGIEYVIREGNNGPIFSRMACALNPNINAVFTQQY